MSEYVYGTDEQGGHWLTGEEIVRCRDCEFGKAIESIGCIKFQHVNERLQPKDPDGFCAWGERRDA